MHTFQLQLEAALLWRCPPRTVRAVPVRDLQLSLRAAAKVMQDDFSNALTSKGPCFIIYSRRTWAFRNKQDEQADVDQADAADRRPERAQVHSDG